MRKFSKGNSLKVTLKLPPSKWLWLCVTLRRDFGSFQTITLQALTCILKIRRKKKKNKNAVTFRSPYPTNEDLVIHVTQKLLQTHHAERETKTFSFSPIKTIHFESGILE